MNEPDAPTTPEPPEHEGGQATQVEADAPRPWEKEERKQSSPIVLLAVIAALFAVGAAVLVTTLTSGSEVGTAGAPTAQAPAPSGPEVTLKVFVEQDEAAVEVPDNVILNPGELVMFEVAMAAPGQVRVWVETDGVRTADLGTYEVSGEPGMLADGEDLVAYAVGKPGTVVFRASSAPSGCDGESCDSFVVTVR